MASSSVRPLCTLLALAILTGCRERTPIAKTIPGATPSFVDLQPGWRLRSISPLLKAGAAGQGTVQSTAGNQLTVEAASNFLGYETAFYSAKPSHRTGVRIEFESAKLTQNGQDTPEARPLQNLFPIPKAMRNVRLLYLLRVSNTDHNMAVLAAVHPDALHDLTERVQRDPENCQATSASYCGWLPAGVAVRPESLRTLNGLAIWSPAR